MGFGANLHLIPICLKAETEEELQVLMYLANELNQQKFNYMTPYEKRNGTHVVWFYADIKEFKDPRELSEDEIQFMGVGR